MVEERSLWEAIDHQYATRNPHYSCLVRMLLDATLELELDLDLKTTNPLAKSRKSRDFCIPLQYAWRLCLPPIYLLQCPCFDRSIPEKER